LPAASEVAFAVKLLRSEVSPDGEVLMGKLNFTWRKPYFTGSAYFTFAEQKLHFTNSEFN